MAKILRQLGFNIKKSEHSPSSSSPVNENCENQNIVKTSVTSPALKSEYLVISEPLSSKKSELAIADFYSDPIDIKQTLVTTTKTINIEKPSTINEDNYCVPYETNTKDTVLRIEEATYEEPWDLDSTQLDVLKQLSQTLNDNKQTSKPADKTPLHKSPSSNQKSSPVNSSLDKKNSRATRSKLHTCASSCTNTCTCYLLNASNSDTNLLIKTPSPNHCKLSADIHSTASESNLILEDSGIHSDEVSDELFAGLDQTDIEKRLVVADRGNDYYNTRSNIGGELDDVRGGIKIDANLETEKGKILVNKSADRKDSSVELSRTYSPKHTNDNECNCRADAYSPNDIKQSPLIKMPKDFSPTEDCKKPYLRKGSKDLGDLSDLCRDDSKNWRRSTFVPETKKSEVPPYRCLTVTRSPRKQVGKEMVWLNESPWKLRHNTNPSLPLDEQPWYHGSISRSDAESLLKSTSGGSFLVRMSESCKDDFSLSIKNGQGFIHVKIVKEEDHFILGQHSQPFASIPHIVRFFSENRLPIRGDNQVILLHPIVNELL